MGPAQARPCTAIMWLTDARGILGLHTDALWTPLPRLQS